MPNFASSKTAFKSEIAIDRKTCREVSKCITYKLSQATRSSYHSLIDRGTDRGVAGNDVRIIERHPDKTLSIKCIDNHEVPSMPTATASGVTNTTLDEVILLSHQYAYHPNVL